MKKLAFLLGLVLLLCGGCKYFKKSTPKSVDLITADTASAGEIMDSSDYYGEVSESATPAIPVQTFTQGAVAGKYYMIVGCFTVSTNADNYAEKIRGMGYEAQIIAGVNNFQMVTARSYDNYRQSVADLDKFRNEVTPNAWIYKQR